MSDAPNPAAPHAGSPTSVPSPSDPAPPTASPKRWDWRPKVRWFAAEYLIVVLGVLTAVGLNAWWQGRQDDARERAYLEQLHTDLVASEEDLEELIPWFEARALGAAGVVHAFWQDAPPPQDSLARWLLSPLANRRYRPSLGTAEAIVSTGDLRLISDDSLRTEIVGYIEAVEADLEDVRRYDETYYRRAQDTLPQEFDPSAVAVAAFRLDSTDNRRVGMTPVPQTYDRIPFPVEFDTVVNDPRIYSAYSRFLVAHRNMSVRYASMLDNTQELRVFVERALEE